MNPCFPADDIICFTKQFFDPVIHIFQLFFHMNLTFPCESEKQTSMKYLLNVNPSLEVIVSDSLVCVK